MKRFQTFSEFYPFYLREHQVRACKILHFLGAVFSLASLLFVIVTGSWSSIWLPALFGYGPAWTGHYFFEKNPPATFTYPVYSLAGNFVLSWHLITGKLSFKSGAQLKT